MEVSAQYGDRFEEERSWPRKMFAFGCYISVDANDWYRINTEKVVGQITLRDDIDGETLTIVKIIKHYNMEGQILYDYVGEGVSIKHRYNG